MKFSTFEALFQSAAYREAGQRVVRQLLEALLFEGALPDVAWSDDVLSMTGTDAAGESLFYRCHARRTVSFGRIRIVSSVFRVQHGVETIADDVARVVAELGPQLGADPIRLAQFGAELSATHIKDAQTRAAQAGKSLRSASYDEVESALVGAHPYHPGYKSRMGFTLDDNERYAPECSPGVVPLLVAVHREHCRSSVSRDVSDRDPLHLLSPEERAAFEVALVQRGLMAADYVPLPIHPWQWSAIAEATCHSAFARRELVPIGPLFDRYRPQQSIRTLANMDRLDAPALKLAMNLINTSTSRVLAPHTVCNAAPISDWLDDIVARTDWPEPLAKPVILKEIAGVAYVPPASVAGQYGALGCIWRESVHRHLRADEAALPVTALTHIDADGRPLIADWVARHGTRAWVRTLVERVWLPVLHLLWHNGTALESHAQNMVLLHAEGMPTRVALKDFHDGVRYSKQWLSVAPPALNAAPAEHAQVNPNSFIETDDANELRDFTCDALFFVNLAEIAWFFSCHFNLEEAEFWAIVARAIHEYQLQCPHLADRFELFNCFAPEMEIELLGSRRFLPEIRLRTRAKVNPLAQTEYA